jgi:hypothetical protein
VSKVVIIFKTKTQIRLYDVAGHPQIARAARSTGIKGPCFFRNTAYIDVIVRVSFLWGASCCVILSHFLSIPAIPTETLVPLF